MSYKYTGIYSEPSKSEIQDLIDVSFKAHCQYVYPRMKNKVEQEGFEDGANTLSRLCFSGMGKGKKYRRGAEFAVDIYDEVVKNLTERFISGYSKEYMEGIRRI